MEGSELLLRFGSAPERMPVPRLTNPIGHRGKLAKVLGRHRKLGRRHAQVNGQQIGAHQHKLLEIRKRLTNRLNLLGVQCVVAVDQHRTQALLQTGDLLHNADVQAVGFSLVNFPLARTHQGLVDRLLDLPEFVADAGGLGGHAQVRRHFLAELRLHPPRMLCCEKAQRGPGQQRQQHRHKQDQNKARTPDDQRELPARHVRPGSRCQQAGPQLGRDAGHVGKLPLPLWLNDHHRSLRADEITDQIGHVGCVRHDHAVGPLRHGL